MRVLSLICLMVFWCSPLSAETLRLRLISDTSETWQARETPQEPLNERETLALRAVDTQSTAVQDKLTAIYLGKRDVYDIVTVDEAPEVETEGVHAVNSFQFHNRMIVYATRIKYVVKPNFESEQIAREIALDYLHGRNTRMPVIFNGKMYTVEYNGKCTIAVLEKEDQTTVFAYRYTRCN